MPKPSSFHIISTWYTEKGGVVLLFVYYDSFTDILYPWYLYITALTFVSSIWQRDLPVGILGSLLVCITLYVCVCLVITGMVPYQNLGADAPLAEAFTAKGLKFVSVLISIGAVAGLATTLLVGLYVQVYLNFILVLLFAKISKQYFLFLRNWFVLDSFLLQWLKFSCFLWSFCLIFVVLFSWYCSWLGHAYACSTNWLLPVKVICRE